MTDMQNRLSQGQDKADHTKPGKTRDGMYDHAAYRSHSIVK